MPFRAAKILIAEDEALIALSLSHGLVVGGHAVCGVVATMTDALACARRHHPDMALLDVHLARGSDGRDIARTLRRELGIPSIFVSAQISADEARLLDVLGLIPKPYTHDDVLRAVNDAITILRGAAVPPTPSPYLFLPDAARQRSLVA